MNYFFYYSFFFIFIIINLNLFARPDLKINNIGDNIYGTLNTGKGGSYTYLEGKNGIYNKLTLIIENDNQTVDNTTIAKDEIYFIDIKLPSSKWKYYFEYKTIKYTEKWATSLILPAKSDYFNLYIKPPPNTEAKTYPIIINSYNNDNKTDSFLINFNVIQSSKLDLYLEFDNLTTIGKEIYEDTYFYNQIYTLYVEPFNKYKLNFRIQNLGNLASGFYMEFKSPDYSPDVFNFYLNKLDITRFIGLKYSYYIKPQDNISLDVFIDANKIKKNGYFLLKLYDNNLNLVDEFKINIISSKIENLIKYKIKNFYNQNLSYLIFVNTSENNGNILFDNQSILIKPFSQNFIIENNTDISITSTNKIYSMLINFNKDYCINSIIYPENTKFDGKSIIFPLMLIFNDNDSMLKINNLLNKKANVNMLIYSFNGEIKINKNFEIDSLSDIDLKLKDLNLEKGIYWIIINSDSEISGYLYNKVLNCYMYYKGISYY